MCAAQSLTAYIWGTPTQMSESSLSLLSYLSSSMLPYKFQIFKATWNFALLPQPRNPTPSSIWDPSSCSTIVKCHRWKSREILVNHWPHVVCLPFQNDHSPMLSFGLCLKIVTLYILFNFIVLAVVVCLFLLRRQVTLLWPKAKIIWIYFFS